MGGISDLIESCARRALEAAEKVQEARAALDIDEQKVRENDQ